MADVGLPRPRGVAYHVGTPPGCATPRLCVLVIATPTRRTLWRNTTPPLVGHFPMAEADFGPISSWRPPMPYEQLSRSKHGAETKAKESTQKIVR